MKRVAALFVHENSVYDEIRGVSAYPKSVGAESYRGPWPVVAHPPCRLFCKLRRFSTAPESEKHLAAFAVWSVRRWGGVLEHPYGSKLFDSHGLPGRGERDAWGGFRVELLQQWFGSPMKKSTWLYVVGVDPREVVVPLRLGVPLAVCGRRWSGARVTLSARRRSETPAAFAEWLVSLASRCRSPGGTS
jgi:hypothetical protein